MKTKSIKNLLSKIAISLASFSILGAGIVISFPNRSEILPKKLSLNTKSQFTPATEKNIGLNIVQSMGQIETSPGKLSDGPLAISNNSNMSIRTETHLINFFQSPGERTTGITVNLATGHKQITNNFSKIIGSTVISNGFIIAAISRENSIPAIAAIEVSPEDGRLIIRKEFPLHGYNFNSDFDLHPISLSPVYTDEVGLSTTQIVFFQSGLAFVNLTQSSAIISVSESGDLDVQRKEMFLQSSTAREKVLGINFFRNSKSKNEVRVDTYNVIAYYQIDNTIEVTNFFGETLSTTPSGRIIGQDASDLGINVLESEKMIKNFIPYARIELLHGKPQLLFVLPYSNNSFITTIQYNPYETLDHSTLTVIKEQQINLTDIGIKIKNIQYGNGGSFEDENIYNSIKFTVGLNPLERVGIFKWEDPNNTDNWNARNFNNFITGPLLKSLEQNTDLLGGNINISNWNDKAIIEISNPVGLVDFKTYFTKVNPETMKFSYDTKIANVITLESGLDFQSQKDILGVLITSTSNSLAGNPVMNPINNKFYVESLDQDIGPPLTEGLVTTIDINLSSYWENGVLKGRLATPSTLDIKKLKVKIIKQARSEQVDPITINNVSSHIFTNPEDFGTNVISKINLARDENGNFPFNWQGIDGLFGTTSNHLIQISDSYFPLVSDIKFVTDNLNGIIKFDVSFSNFGIIETISTSINGFLAVSYIIGGSFAGIVLLLLIILLIIFLIHRLRTKKNMSKALTAGFQMSQNLGGQKEIHDNFDLQTAVANNPKKIGLVSVSKKPIGKKLATPMKNPDSPIKK